MARFELVEDTLILHLSLLERFGALVHGDAYLPIKAVRDARATDDPWGELRGVRMPGTGWPGKIALGTRRFAGGKDFAAVYGKGPAVIVDLNGVAFSRLVVSTRDAQPVADEINAAVLAAREL